MFFPFILTRKKLDERVVNDRNMRVLAMVHGGPPVIPGHCRLRRPRDRKAQRPELLVRHFCGRLLLLFCQGPVGHKFKIWIEMQGGSGPGTALIMKCRGSTVFVITQGSLVVFSTRNGCRRQGKKFIVVRQGWQVCAQGWTDERAWKQWKLCLFCIVI